MKHLIVNGQAATGYSGYSPDVPGCIATGDTRDEVEQNMKAAVAFHLDGLKAEGMGIPEPSSSSAYVEIPEYHEMTVQSSQVRPVRPREITHAREFPER